MHRCIVQQSYKHRAGSRVCRIVEARTESVSRGTQNVPPGPATLTPVRRAIALLLVAFVIGGCGFLKRARGCRKVGELLAGHVTRMDALGKQIDAATDAVTIAAALDGVAKEYVDTGTKLGELDIEDADLSDLVFDFRQQLQGFQPFALDMARAARLGDMPGVEKAEKNFEAQVKRAEDAGAKIDDYCGFD